MGGGGGGGREGRGGKGWYTLIRSVSFFSLPITVQCTGEFFVYRFYSAEIQCDFVFLNSDVGTKDDVLWRLILFRVNGNLHGSLHQKDTQEFFISIQDEHLEMSKSLKKKYVSHEFICFPELLSRVSKSSHYNVEIYFRVVSKPSKKLFNHRPYFCTFFEM